MVKPKEETNFDKGIEGNKGGKEEQALFKDANETEYNPISQPLFVIRVGGRVKCLE